MSKITHGEASRKSLEYADKSCKLRKAGLYRDSDEARDKALYWHQVAARMERGA